MLSVTGCGSQHPLRALGGTCVLLAAAPTTPPCFRRWRRSSLLQFTTRRNVYQEDCRCLICLDAHAFAAKAKEDLNSTAPPQVGQQKPQWGFCLVSRVAAPSIRFVPWMALASCWPLPQQLLPVSAAGGGRRCCSSQPVGMSTGRTTVKIENPNLFSIGEGFGFFVFFGNENAAVAQQ